MILFRMNKTSELKYSRSMSKHTLIDLDRHFGPSRMRKGFSVHILLSQGA